jgi:UDP-3-O-[3-hydroxymyristoyl] N-acetylglucosamine deacetylase
MKQKTISKEIFIEGVGVHSGEKSTVTLKPAAPNSGITLYNKNFPKKKLSIGSVIPEQAMHATVLKCDCWAVSTVEHLFAAIYGLEIDNLEIVFDGPEFPILDGSALPFVHLILEAGLIEQNCTKKFLTPKKIISFEEDDRFIEIKPATGNDFSLKFYYSIDFSHPLLPKNEFCKTLTRGAASSQKFFIDEIAPARTFGFLEQLPILRKHGLAKGTTLGNTVVVGEEAFLNTRRFEDEFIRHKFLDLLGDLALLGKNLAGTIVAHKTGHAFNRKVVKHYVENPDLWKIL